MPLVSSTLDSTCGFGRERARVFDIRLVGDDMLANRTEMGDGGRRCLRP